MRSSELRRGAQDRTEGQPWPGSRLPSRGAGTGVAQACGSAGRGGGEESNADGALVRRPLLAICNFGVIFAEEGEWVVQELERVV